MYTSLPKSVIILLWTTFPYLSRYYTQGIMLLFVKWYVLIDYIIYDFHFQIIYKA